MTRLTRKQAKEIIETHLAQHPNATTPELGKVLGVSKQRAHILLKLVGIASTTLTNREEEILHHMATGETNREIAEGLNIAERTVKNEVTVILAKLNATNRTHAVTTALQRGLISLDKVELTKTASK